MAFIRGSTVPSLGHKDIGTRAWAKLSWREKCGKEERNVQVYSRSAIMLTPIAHQDCSRQSRSGTAILHSDSNHTHFCTFTSSSSP